MERPFADQTNHFSLNMEERPVKRARLESAAMLGQNTGPDVFSSDANEVITFHLVERPEDLEDGNSVAFNPEFTHQQFGDDQIIKGYKGLSIDIYMDARDFYTFIDVKYDKKHVMPDHDLDKILSDSDLGFGPGGFTRDRGAFLARLAAGPAAGEAGPRGPAPADMGELLSTSTLRDGSSLAIYRAALSDAPTWLRAAHARLQPLLLFFIDAASYVDAEDSAWFAHYAVRSGGPKALPARVAGFTTLYDFFAYPDRTRTRLSQILVLPPLQGLGIGRLMLEAANKVVEKREDILELTYEDPTDALNRIRDMEDARRLLGRDWFRAAVRGSVEGARAAAATPGTSVETVTRRLAGPADFYAAAQAELKLPKHQAGRVWELVLASAPALRSTPLLEAALNEAVARRLGCDAAERRQQVARGKITRPTENNQKSSQGGRDGDDNWIMTKVPGVKRRGVAPPVPVSPGQTPGPSSGATPIPTSILKEGEGVPSPSPEPVFVEPEEVVKQREEQLKERLSDRLAELASIRERLEAEVTEALARA